MAIDIALSIAHGIQWQGKNVVKAQLSIVWAKDYLGSILEV